MTTIREQFDAYVKASQEKDASIPYALTVKAYKAIKDAPPLPNYSVHHYSQRNSFHYTTAHTLTQAMQQLRTFVENNESYTMDNDDPGAWADVYLYDERDDETQAYGDYPIARYELTARNAIRRASL